MSEQHFFDYEEPNGDRFAVCLRIGDTEEPWIVVRDQRGVAVMDFAAAALFRLEIAGAKVEQVIGDGPQVAQLSGSRAYQAAELALARLTRARAGTFRVVWCPNDPTVPF